MGFYHLKGAFRTSLNSCNASFSCFFCSVLLPVACKDAAHDIILTVLEKFALNAWKSEVILATCSTRQLVQGGQQQNSSKHGAKEDSVKTPSINYPSLKWSWPQLSLIFLALASAYDTSNHAGCDELDRIQSRLPRKAVYSHRLNWFSGLSKKEIHHCGYIVTSAQHCLQKWEIACSSSGLYPVMAVHSMDNWAMDSISHVFSPKSLLLLQQDAVWIMRTLGDHFVACPRR